MEIHLLRNGVKTGPFALEEVQQMVTAKHWSLNDYAWYQGLGHWVPLSRIFSGNLSSVPPPFPTSHAGGAKRSWMRKIEAIFEIIFSDFTGEITTVAGVEKIQGLSEREFLSNVLRKRKDDEMEELFTTGTRSATPLLKDVDTQWPKPWVFFKAIIISFILFAGFYLGSVVLGNTNMIPGAILVGSFAIPTAVLIFFIEMNVARNFSVYQTLKLVLMGGLLSLLIALLFDKMTPSPTDSTGTLTWGGAALVGLVEESSKLLAVIVFMGYRRFNWSLNGLLIGAAVGAGFSAFESAGYALNSMLKLIKDQSGAFNLNIMGMIHTIELRALLAPFMHIMWTALPAAALWKVKSDRPFQLTMLLDFRFLRVFLMVVLFHALWDSPWGNLLTEALIGFIGWVVVFGYIQDGLKQIRKAQSTPPPLPLEVAPADISQPRVA